MVLKQIKQIFKSYMTKWLKWPVITGHYPIFAALDHIKILLQFYRKKDINRRIELNSCKILIWDLSLKKKKKKRFYKILSNRKDELNKMVCLQIKYCLSCSTSNIAILISNLSANFSSRKITTKILK